MNQLNKLIGLKVIAYYEDIEFKGIIIDYNIIDEYFYEKGETIYITVNLNTIENENYDELKNKYGDDFYDAFNDIPLENIFYTN